MLLRDIRKKTFHEIQCWQNRTPGIEHMISGMRTGCIFDKCYERQTGRSMDLPPPDVRISISPDLSVSDQKLKILQNNTQNPNSFTAANVGSAENESFTSDDRDTDICVRFAYGVFYRCQENCPTPRISIDSQPTLPKQLLFPASLKKLIPLSLFTRSYACDFQ